MKIYMTIGTNTVAIDKARTMAEAENRIARFMREDRYSVEVEKYAMPASWGGVYPVYTVGK